MSIPPLGGVLVNRDGQRFVREDVGPSALAAHVLAQPGGVALEVFDAAIEAQLGNASAYQAARTAGQVLQADTVEDLAAQAGVPAPALRGTLAEVAAWAAAGVAGTGADPLGRERFARALQPPYRASWVTGALSHTQGGLLTDADGRVLGPDGRPLPGLFATGGCAAGLVARGGEGYLPGNGLAQAFGLGWRVAQALA
jgi:fumarate reductase flavoprotein subunit